MCLSLFIIIEEVYSAKQWLQTDGLNYSNIILIKEKWMITYDLRKSEIFESNEPSVLDIFLKWPKFQNSKGYELLCTFIV